MLPSAVCEHCQQQLLTAYKFKRRVTFLQDFQIALAVMRHRNDPEPMRQKFLTDYEYMSSVFRELNLLDQEQMLRWEDLLTDPEEPTGEENVRVIVEDGSDGEVPQILHVEIVDDNDSDGGYTYHSEGSMDHQDVEAEIEYLNVEPVAEGADDVVMVMEQPESGIAEQPTVVEEKGKASVSIAIS